MPSSCLSGPDEAGEERVCLGLWCGVLEPGMAFQERGLSSSGVHTLAVVEIDNAR